MWYQNKIFKQAVKREESQQLPYYISSVLLIQFIIELHFSSLSRSLWMGIPIGCIKHFSQFCIIWKFVEAALCPISQIINEGFEQYWTDYQLLQLAGIMKLLYIIHVSLQRWKALIHSVRCPPPPTVHYGSKKRLLTEQSTDCLETTWSFVFSWAPKSWMDMILADLWSWHSGQLSDFSSGPSQNG